MHRQVTDKKNKKYLYLNKTNNNNRDPPIYI